MLTSTPAYKLARTFTNQRKFTFDVRTLEGEPLLADVPILSGDVAASLTSRVTRDATFFVSDEFFPRTATDPLSPFHAIVSIKAGVQYPDGTTEIFPVFVGRIYSITRVADGSVRCRADDLAADVVAAQFEVPQNSQRGASVLDQIEALIRDALPTATFGTHDVDDAPVPSLTWDADRGKALDDLAAAVSGRWYALGDGSFVVRRYPYITDQVDIEISDGPEGTVITADQTISADETANSVVVISERADGAAPIRVIARNEEPESIARFGGPFGKRVMTVKVQTPITTSEAQQVAVQQLASASALTEQWNVSMVPDMTLEPSDVVGITWRGIRSVQVLDTVTYPLSPASEQRLTARSAVASTLNVG